MKYNKCQIDQQKALDWSKKYSLTGESVFCPDYRMKRLESDANQPKALSELKKSMNKDERLLEVENLGTKDAYWELQKDLREPGEISNKLLQFFQQDSDQVISFNWTLAAILRGEYLNK